MSGSKKTLLSLLLFLFFLPVLAGCSEEVITEEFYQAYQVKSGTILEIQNPNGEINVTGWEEDKVEISAVKMTTGGQPALDAVDIFIDIADWLVIKTVHPDGVEDVAVNYDIKVPEDVLVGVIECSNGNINVQGVNGNPAIYTNNGTVQVADVNGRVSARSINGDIIVTGVQELSDLRTSNGDIEADLPALHEDLNIITSNGSIALFVEPTLSVNLEASTSNGSINIGNLNMEISEQEQTSLVCLMNDGGYNINISTSNGSIDLEPLS